MINSLSGGDIGPELPLELSAEAEGSLSLLGHALGKELNITCKALTPEAAMLKAEGASSGKLSFSGCIVTTKGGEVLPACEPHTGTEKGVIRTNALKGSIVLSEGEPLERIEPVEGTRFVVVETTASCAFGEKIPIIGTFNAKDADGEFEVEKNPHRFEAGPLPELWVISKSEEHKSSASGVVSVKLAGEHEGRRWNGLAA